MKELTVSIVGYMDYDDIAWAVRSIEEYTPAAVDKTIYLVDNGAAYDPQYAVKKGEIVRTGRLDMRSMPRVHDELQALESCYEDVECIASVMNAGFGAGHNQVLGLLNSRYHAIVNPDITIDEDVFSPMMEYLDEHSDVMMLTPRLIGTDGELLHVYRRDPTVLDCFVRRFVPWGFKKRGYYHTMQDQDYSKVFDLEFAQGSFMLIRTELFKKLKGFDERYFMYMEDADLCRRVREHGRIQYFPYVKVTHKWARGSKKNLRLFAVHVGSMFSYFMKWGWKWS